MRGTNVSLHVWRSLWEVMVESALMWGFEMVSDNEIPRAVQAPNMILNVLM